MSVGFQFKQFYVKHQKSAMKVGTDGMLLGVLAPTFNVRRVLDIGTGTGLIALMIAQRNPHSIVDAVEIDGDAASEALENFKASPFCSRLNLFNCCIEQYVQASQVTGQSPSNLYDLVVMNPPFYDSEKHIYSTQRAQARATSALSHLDFIKLAYPLIAAQKHIYLILPVLEGIELLKNLFGLDDTLIEVLFQSNGEVPVVLINNGQLQLQTLVLIKFTPAKAVKRLIIGLKKVLPTTLSTTDELVATNPLVILKDDAKLVQFELQHLTLRDNDGAYTSEMKLLTKDFLLKH